MVIGKVAVMARIAVIGAGAGALAAAARLAVAGHRVTVYERTETYGGAVRRFERDGFAFDTGPGLLPLPAVYRDLFVKTGKEPLERVDALLTRKEGILNRVRRHLRIKALLEVWLYVHVPVTFALIAALSAHIVSVFFYW